MTDAGVAAVVVAGTVVTTTGGTEATAAAAERGRTAVVETSSEKRLQVTDQSRFGVLANDELTLICIFKYWGDFPKNWLCLQIGFGWSADVFDRLKKCGALICKLLGSEGKSRH